MHQNAVNQIVRTETKISECVDMVKFGTAPLDVMNRHKMTQAERCEFLRRVELMRAMSIVH